MLWCTPRMQKPVAKTVCRAVYPVPSAVQPMGIDHCCTDILVAQQFLNRADIVPIFQEVRGKGMPQGVATDRLVNPGFARGFFGSAV